MASKLADILAGSNDGNLLDQLCLQIESPSNRAQALFADAVQISEFIASDGLEILFEQDRSLDEFVQAFVDVGFPEVRPVFQKAKAVVPDALWAKKCEPEFFDHLRDNFDRLKELWEEYLDLSNEYLFPALGNFVRRHQGEFAELITAGDD